ncbi:IS3 family transposase [Mycoplasma capricolum]|uniref:Transposase (IS3 family), putative n=2 Tax=Mycoplasma capricolum TaxID=2095 RepID=Q2SSG2_MYCCT|nr:IS3 family transposase [Mycoplasma capricolum]ABC01531.1 transposase (IS3 family), putative [Mycoplasma capricolum subsp. capricolum ATCC 27343]
MKYSFELKLKVIFELQKLAIKQVYKKYNINYNTLKYWKYNSKKILNELHRQEANKRKTIELEQEVLLEIQNLWNRVGKKNNKLFKQIEKIRKKHKIKLKQVLVFLKISRSLYYKKLKQEVNINKIEKSIKLEKEIISIFNKRPRGYRKIKEALLKEFNWIVNHKVILKIMRKFNLIVGWLKNKRNNKHKTGRNKFNTPDLINREFKKVKEFGKVLYTDVTYIIWKNERVYLSTILDGATRQIIDYRISDKNNSNLINTNFKNAISKLKQLEINIKNIIIHSDHAVVYEANSFRKICKKYQIRQSMGSNYSCTDNAVIESYHGQLKKNTIHSNKKKYKIFQDYLNDLFSYLRWHNKEKGSEINLNKRKILRN